MEIEKAAVAGTLESSDCMVTVEDGDGKSRSGTGKHSDSSVWKSDPSCGSGYSEKSGSQNVKIKVL